MTVSYPPEWAFPHVDYNGDVLGGEQYLFRFDNGFGASVIRHNGSYGHELGLWELALIEWYNNDVYELIYHIDDYSDVKGWLTEGDVNQHLEWIAARQN